MYILYVVICIQLFEWNVLIHDNSIVLQQQETFTSITL